MAGSIELSVPGITSSLAGARQNTESSLEKTYKRADVEGQDEDYNIEPKAASNVADALNSVAKAIDRNLQFSVDKETGRIVIKVTDGETGELIRVIPPDDISKMRRSFGSLVGLIFSEES